MTRAFRRLVAIFALLGGLAGAQDSRSAQPHAVVMPPPSAAELQYRQTCELSSTKLLEAVQQARLPFLLLSWRTDAACVPTVISFSGTGNIDALRRALVQAGLTVTVQVNTAPPVVFPPAGRETWPLTAVVAPISAQHMGGVLEVPVRLRNLTFFEQPFSYGASVLGYILLNDRAEAVRWDGDGLKILPLYSSSCPALQICNLENLQVSLDQFNPDLPLPPGHYALRLRVNRLGVNNSELSTTLSDLPFDIIL